MSKRSSTTVPIPRRFSRTSLNIMIIGVALLILVFSMLGQYPSDPNAQPGSSLPNSATLTSAPAAEVSSVSDLPESNASPEDQTQAATLVNTSNPELLELLNNTPSLEPKPLSIDIQTWQHDSGASVYFISAPNLPMLDLRLIFNAGSARDGQLPGLASLTASLFDEGTQPEPTTADSMTDSTGMSVDDIAKALESIGAQFSGSALRDMAVLSMRTLTLNQYPDTALDLLTKMIGQPSFPEDSIARIKAQMLQGLEYQKQNPSALINKAMWTHLYPDHVYGQPNEGTAESLPKIQREDIVSYYNTYYASANAALAMVGAIDRDRAKTIADQILNALPTGKQASALPTPVAITDQHIHIPYPSEQTHIRIAQLGMTRSLDNIDHYVNFYLGNEVLGGSGFSSILNQRIRQDNGLAYSVYSSFTAMQTTGPFWVSLKTANDQASKALTLSLEELNRFVATGPTEQQVQTTQANLINSHPLQLTSNSSQLSYIGHLGFYQLPLTTLTHFTEQVTQATRSSIHQAWQQRFATQDTPTAWLIITLGPEKPKLNS